MARRFNSDPYSWLAILICVIGLTAFYFTFHRL